MSKPYYIVRNLFGEEEKVFFSGYKMKKNLFSDYDAFVEKFEVKKTTDDCYTPEPVYDAILSWVRNRYNLEGKTIIRPFVPGGDYTAVPYDENSVVVDNPPFSILASILDWYNEHDVKFFLFAPGLTCFNLLRNRDYVSIIITDTQIIYDNKARVRTAFVTNIEDQPAIIVDGQLKREIEKANANNTKQKLNYIYPPNLITVSKLAHLANAGIDFKIERKHTHVVPSLDEQRAYKKGVFGSGLLVANSIAGEYSMKREEAESMKREEAESMKREGKVHEWQLSDRELEIIDMLNKLSK